MISNAIKMLLGFLLVIVVIVGSAFAKPEVYDDVSRYNDFIGENAIEDYYKIKFGMDESIFPKEITENMDVKDYKMVFYDPWDAQYLSYLVVDYNDEDYAKEVARLKEYKSTKYIGIYGVTGFTKYQLLAINADDYQGFVYALTDNENQIIYVELIFCNYVYDLDYEKYINKDYLPDGFDAKQDNDYRKEEMERRGI